MKKLILPLAIIMFMACKKDSSVANALDKGIIIDQTFCSFFLDSNLNVDTTMVIVNQQQLDDLQSSSACTIPTVDFSNQIVLHYQFKIPYSGLYKSKVAVYDNQNENRYAMIYIIEKTENGVFYPGMYSVLGATVIVPKPVTNYTYEFNKIYIEQGEE